jgi:hypothetical protein
MLLWMFLQPDNRARRCRNWKMPVETAFTGLIRGRTYCPGATTALISGECRLINALSQTDGTGQRSSLARMASADWVHTKGLGQALCSAR